MKLHKTYINLERMNVTNVCKNNNVKKEVLLVNILTCTEAAEQLELTKRDVRALVEQGVLNNYGNQYRFMISEDEVLKLRKSILLYLKYMFPKVTN